ncbi:unnamed protein product [Prunus armeniaca]
MGRDGRIEFKIAEVSDMRDEACYLNVCVACWVEEASFIAARSYPFPRNPNGFYLIWPSISLPFPPHPFNHPILVKSTLPICTKSGIFGSSRPLSRNCFSGRLPFSAISLFSYLPPSMARYDEGKQMDIYVGSKGASPSGSLRANISWFFGYFCLKLVPPHVLEPPSSLHTRIFWLSSWLLFSARCWRFCIYFLAWAF